jgi:hypothetical protein
MQPTLSDRAKSIVGTVLVGLGILVLSGKLDHATMQLNHFLGTILGTLVVKALWALPTAIFEVSRGLQAHITHQQRFLDGSFRHTVFQHTVVSSWPLALVIVGTVLSSDACPNNIWSAFKKRLQMCRSDSRSFDGRVEGRSSQLKRRQNNALHGDCQG